jgi:polar amino acid transport system substrate-binding protein
VATVPTNQLDQAGQLRVCADEPSPPGVFYNSSEQLVGYDVDLAKAIGHRLGLQTKEVPTVFDTIIEAAKTGKCDIVIDSMFIEPSRLKQIDFVPYETVGQQFLIKTGGQPLGNVSADPLILCGKAIAATTGSGEATALQTYSQKCKAAGKPAIKQVIFNDASPALQAVLTGQVDALFDDYPIVAYYVKLHPAQFTLNKGTILNTLQAGVAVPPGKTQLETAVQKAVKALAADGTYHKIFAAWGATGLELPHPGYTIERSKS